MKVNLKEKYLSLKVEFLIARQQRGDMILMFNISHGLLGVRNNFFQAPHCHTRGHRFKVDFPLALSRIRRNQLSDRAVDAWSRLPHGLWKHILSMASNAILTALHRQSLWCAVKIANPVRCSNWKKSELDEPELIRHWNAPCRSRIF